MTDWVDAVYCPQMAGTTLQQSNLLDLQYTAHSMSATDAPLLFQCLIHEYLAHDQ